MKHYIGIDLGGTVLKGAVVSEDGEILQKAEVPSQAYRSADAIRAEIQTLIENLKKTTAEPVAAIGCGIPGIIDRRLGLVRRSPHFPEWNDVPLKDALERRLKAPIFLDNDANCAALGEAWKGTVRASASFVMLTLGTGIGGAIMINREIWHGDLGFAGELGHLVIEADGLPCACGGRGCLELYASASALKRMAEQQGMGALTALKIAEQARSGNQQAQSLFDHFAYYLGAGIGSLVSCLGIHTVVLGGAVSHSADLFMSKLEEEVSRRLYPPSSAATQILIAKLGNDAGVIGAAYGASLNPVSRKA
jgi:glucokinase